MIIKGIMDEYERFIKELILSLIMARVLVLVLDLALKPRFLFKNRMG